MCAEARPSRARGEPGAAAPAEEDTERSRSRSRRPFPQPLPAPTCRLPCGRQAAHGEEERAEQRGCCGSSHGSAAPARPLAPTSRRGAGPAGKGGVTGRDGTGRPAQVTRAGRRSGRPRHLGSTASGRRAGQRWEHPTSPSLGSPRCPLLLSPLCRPRCLPRSQHRVTSQDRFDWKRSLSSLPLELSVPPRTRVLAVPSVSPHSAL